MEYTYPHGRLRRAGLLWGEDQEGGHLWLDGLDHVADRIRQTPTKEIWSFRTEQRKALLEYAWTRYSAQVVASASDRRALPAADEVFDPNVLTIGFARRFATYKRATLLLSDPDRLKRLLLDQQRPIQLIVAGKRTPTTDSAKHWCSK